jgi:cytochrome oxidase assembly protein ShyY1
LSAVLRVLRQPRWLALLLVLPLLMGLALLAANWQYGRHERRSAQEQRVDQARSVAPVPLASVLAPGEPISDDQRYTAVTVTGEYDQSSVLIRNRPQNETPGLWVVTGLRMPDGSGVLQPSEPKRGAGILSNGEATSLNTQTLCPDTSCYQTYLQATSSTPADSDQLQLVPVKGPGLGPHLGYAGQWLIFAALLPVGYIILIRREVKEAQEPTDALTGSG